MAIRATPNERTSPPSSATSSATSRRDLALFERALTHSSRRRATITSGSNSSATACSAWSSPTGSTSAIPNEPEGNLSQPLQCAGRARDLRRDRRASSAFPALIRLGKQAREDGASQSDNVVGDVVEALIGALCLDGGLEAARALHPAAPGSRTSPSSARAPQHPKSALQELAAAQGRQGARSTRSSAAPARTTRRTSPSGSRCRRSAKRPPKGTSKQEAETAAAAALLEQLQ